MARDFTKYKKEQPSRSTDSKRSMDMYNIGSPYRRNTDESRLENVEVNKLIPFQGKTPFNDYIGTEKFETLVRDIEENGVITPIIVRALPDGRYEVLAGRHRSEALKHLHRAVIPANIYPTDTTDEKAMMIHLSTNLMNGRDQMSVIEQIQALVAYESTVEKLSGARSDRQQEGEKIDRYQQLADIFKLGSRTTAINYLKIGKTLPEDILLKVPSQLPFTVAYKLVEQEEEFKEEVYTYLRGGKKLTAKQLETLIDNYKIVPTAEMEVKTEAEGEVISGEPAEMQESAKESVFTSKEFDNVLKNTKKKKFCTVKIDKECLPERFNNLEDNEKAELIISLISRWNDENFS